MTRRSRNLTFIGAGREMCEQAPSGVNKIVSAKVRIVSKNTIEVWSDEITDPRQILGLRYNWGYQLTGNLYNLDGQPAFPFRTDAIKSGLHRQMDVMRAKNRENQP